MLAPHRKVPNRKVEIEERVQSRIRVKLGSRSICTRCGATFVNFDELCTADLGQECPGSNAITNARISTKTEMGLG